MRVLTDVDRQDLASIVARCRFRTCCHYLSGHDVVI